MLCFLAGCAEKGNTVSNPVEVSLGKEELSDPSSVEEAVIIEDDAISSSFSIVPVKDYNYSYLFLESKMSFHFSIFKIYFYLWFSSVCDMAMCVIFIYLSLVGVQ